MLALQIALVHLVYNVLAVTVFMIVPWLKELPIRSATWLGNKIEVNRGWAVGYIAAVFFLLPGVVLAGQALMSETSEESSGAVEVSTTAAD